MIGFQVPGECIPVNEAAPAAKIGAAVFGRTVDLTKPRASGEKRAIVFGIADILVIGQ
jgi:hypothetical protein